MAGWLNLLQFKQPMVDKLLEATVRKEQTEVVQALGWMDPILYNPNIETP